MSFLTWHSERIRESINCRCKEWGDNTRCVISRSQRVQVSSMKVTGHTGRWSLVTGYWLLVTGQLRWSKFIYRSLHGNPKILQGGGRFGRRMMSQSRQFKEMREPIGSQIPNKKTGLDGGSGRRGNQPLNGWALRTDVVVHKAHVNVSLSPGSLMLREESSQCFL